MSIQLGWTDLEQSKKLIEAGLDPNTADMLYEYHGNFENDVTDYDDSPMVCKPIDEDLPCWSLGALIDVLPCFIKEDNDEYMLSIFPDGLGGWMVDYSTFETQECLVNYSDKSLLDALYYMCCYLLENNYIKKETK